MTLSSLSLLSVDDSQCESQHTSTSTSSRETSYHRDHIACGRVVSVTLPSNPPRSFITKPLLSFHRRVKTSLQSKSKLHFPHQSSNGDAQIVSPAQRLPQELLLVIIDHLATPFYLAAFAVGGLLARYYRVKFTSSILHDVRRDLLATVRLCHSWNIAGTQVLYSRPFLMSPKQVQLFSSTLMDNPTLATLVKKIFVLQPERGKFTRLVSQLTARAGPDPSHSLLASSMSTCTSLETLTFTLCPKRLPVFSSWDRNFLRESRVGENLRELAIYGTTNLGGPPLEFLPSDISLPSLEILVLKAISLESNHKFPVLPKLHFLRITMLHRSHLNPERFILDLNVSTFPSLRTLVLHHTGAWVDADDEVLRGLRELKLCGTSERACYQRWIRGSQLDTLTNLEFHLNEVGPGRFTITKYPRHLQTLTLEITFSKDRELKVIKAHALEDFQRAFLTGTEGCKDLARLAIKCHSMRTEDTSEYDDVMETIRRDCASRGVELIEKGPRLSGPPNQDSVYRRLDTWPL